MKGRYFGPYLIAVRVYSSQHLRISKLLTKNTVKIIVFTVDSPAVIA